MTKVLSKIENLIFLVIVTIILILNIYGSIFMLASYWPCLDKNMVFPFIVSLLVTVVLIYMFIVLIISVFASFIRNKRNEFNKYVLFLQLNTVGFFLLQLFIETKPRYVLISFILMIVYASTELFYILLL